MMINQYEVDQENFAGRLHPAQRHLVLRGLSIGLVMTAAAIVVLVLAVLTVGLVPVDFLLLIPVYALLVWGLWLAVRRLLDLRDGRVVAITGWTGREIAINTGAIKVNRDYGKRALKELSNTTTYWVRIGDRSFEVNGQLFERTSANCTNTIFLAPRTKRVLNIARTPT